MIFSIDFILLMFLGIAKSAPANEFKTRQVVYRQDKGMVL
jgi:hypothetical protein